MTISSVSSSWLRRKRAHWHCAGGVGVYAVQLAALAGARVTATASPRDLEFVAGLGAGPGGQPRTADLSAAAQANQVLASAVSDTGDDACLVVVRIR